ncbi:hypothetical protein BTM36_15220, partial [Herbaspirillum sp. VT-16-41]
KSFLHAASVWGRLYIIAVLISGSRSLQVKFGNFLVSFSVQNLRPWLSWLILGIFLLFLFLSLLCKLQLSYRFQLLLARLLARGLWWLDLLCWCCAWGRAIKGNLLRGVDGDCARMFLPMGSAEPGFFNRVVRKPSCL